MSVNIATFLNTTKEEVESKKFNVWIGCSLGNNYFTESNLREFILWALEYTKENVLIVIPDRIYSVNLEVLDGYKPDRALRVAIRKGNEKVEIIQKIITDLPPDKKTLVVIARLAEVEKSKYHSYRLEIIKEEFNKKEEFYQYIMQIIKENPKVKSKDLSVKDLEKLAEYVLNEIPIFLNGAKYGGRPEEGGKTYSLVIYPGLGPIDYLFDGLQKHTLFPELSKRLKITDQIAILEAYVN